jgi:hypothetical protein
MKKQTWTATVRNSIRGPLVIQTRRKGHKGARATEPATPDYVRQYLNITAATPIIADMTWQEVIDLKLDENLLRKTWTRKDYEVILTFVVEAPATVKPRIVIVDFDDATYVGDGNDGVYVAVGKTRKGWYVSSVVDSDTGGFVQDYISDDGPYPTEAAALQAGVYGAQDWCIDNDVDYRDTNGDE